MLKKLFRLLQAPWFIALVALHLRVGFLLYKISVIPTEVLAAVPFQNEVGNVASALASGHGFCCLFRQPTGPTAWLAPVYPLLIAGIFKVFGTFTFRSFCAAVSLNCIFSALACLPLFYASKRLAGKSTAALAAWLWAFWPSAIMLPYAWIWDTSLSAFLAAALLWATLRLADRLTIRDSIFYGLLWGVSLLTNPALSALLPFLLAWLFLQSSQLELSPSATFHPEARAVGGPKDLNGYRLFRLKLILVSFAVIVLTCLPWTIRNYIQFHRFIPLRSNFAYEFWSGNNEIFDPTSRAVNRISRYEQARIYAQFGESTFLDGKWLATATFIRNRPALYARLCGHRIIATWFGTESPWHDFLHADSLLVQLVLAWNALSLLAMLLGSVRLYLRRRTYFLLVAAFPLVFPIAFYLAHTSLRHRHPVDPVIALLVAVAFLGATPQAASGNPPQELKE